MAENANPTSDSSATPVDAGGIELPASADAHTDAPVPSAPSAADHPESTPPSESSPPTGPAPIPHHGLEPAPPPTPLAEPEPDGPRRRFPFNLLGRARRETTAAPNGDQPQPPTVTDRARKLTHVVLHPAGALLVRIGVHPDQITIAGTVLVFVAAALIGLAHLQLGALLLLFALPFDALDGAVARAMGRTDKFGALLDSASDRYADAAIFAGLGYHFAVLNRLELLLLAFAALMGTHAVSYVRARAEGLGVNVKIGLFTRLERLAMILIMLFVPDLLPIGLVILAIGTNFTSVQRLVYVYRVLKQREG
ncbi:MAG: CDP-alcohol phosphatidyltransferase family protein [Anaerolineae bacterium]|nr:CDP-alcohol phosphatidyltransferase family protein [Anaerolineae bacterium]